MFGAKEYAQVVTTGKIESKTGIYTTDDGKRWQSLGNVDFGNNCIYEVMVLETKPTEFNESFCLDQYPVFLANHDDGLESLGQSLPEFLEEMSQEGWSHHLPEIVRQLGECLAKY